jgi:hypothetical protein
MALSRLASVELDSLATYLHGSRWGPQLSRDLQLDPRLLRRWKAGTRPVSCCYSTEIAVLVHDRRVSRAQFERVQFNAMARQHQRIGLEGDFARADHRRLSQMV